MTFSLLARDPETGALGGVAATGNLCVGAWVLRGDPRAGLTASQGLTPSTLWGEDALDMLRDNVDPVRVVTEVTERDSGRDTRQLAVLDPAGRVAAFDGAANKAFVGHRSGEGWVAAGNWLASGAVLDAAARAYLEADGSFPSRLIEAVDAGVAAGSDARGTLSSALLVVALDRPPLSLRIDCDDRPVARLRALYERTCEPGYREWLDTLPTRKTPEAT